VRAWSELPAGAPLFESILGFENYPLDEALREDVGAAVAVAGVEQTQHSQSDSTESEGLGRQKTPS